MKTPRSFRMDDEVWALLAKVADRLKITQAAVIVLAIREFAAQHGIVRKEKKAK